jgi:hypothetical protein
MQAFEGIAHSRSSSNPTEYQRWRESILFARTSLSVAVLSDEQLLKLSSAASNVLAFNVLAKYLYQSTKSHPDSGKGVAEFFLAVDQSDYSLEEWIDAVFVFDEWLKEKQLQGSWLTMLGYLRCASESPENKSLKLPLSVYLEEMLETHGFDSAEQKKSKPL